MTITIKLFASLREGRFDAAALSFPPGAVVREAIASLGIPATAAKIVLVNARHAEAEQVLNEGDVLAIFPPIGGG
jgi:molybdopterin converting factor small subunit